MPYWKCESDPEVLRTRQNDLDALIHFLNVDIEHAKENEFIQEIVPNYVNFTAKDDSQSTFRRFMCDHNRMVGDIKPGTGPELIEEKRGAFRQLQIHLTQRVEAIMKTMESGKPDTLLYIERPFSLHIRPSEDRFIELFDEDFQPDLVLEEEKERREGRAR